MALYGKGSLTLMAFSAEPSAWHSPMAVATARPEMSDPSVHTKMRLNMTALLLTPPCGRRMTRSWYGAAPPGARQYVRRR